MGSTPKRLTRDRFIRRTCDLLNDPERNDVSLSAVLAACGAQKGSLYHFFPDGKDELVRAAVEHIAAIAAGHVGRCLAACGATAEGVYRHVTDLADWQDGSDCPAGMPFTGIAAITGARDEAVRSACGDALKRLENLYAEALARDGLPAGEARGVATFIVSAVDGAFLRARTGRSTRPLRNAAEQLRAFIAGRVRPARG